MHNSTRSLKQLSALRKSDYNIGLMYMVKDVRLRAAVARTAYGAAVTEQRVVSKLIRTIGPNIERRRVRDCTYTVRHFSSQTVLFQAKASQLREVPESGGYLTGQVILKQVQLLELGQIT